MINIKLPKVNATFTVDNIAINKEALSGRSGIYFLRDRNKSLLYVGQAKDFYSRFFAHRSGSGNSRSFADDLVYFDVIYLDSVYEREIYETHAIYELHPPYNRAKTEVRLISQEEYDAQDAISELRDERRQLVEETRKLRESFGYESYYTEDDLDVDDMADWGTILHNEQRIEEIDSEIKTLKAVR